MENGKWTMENEPQVLYEDEYLLAIDKPSGMVVNRGFGATDTVQDWLEANFQFSINMRSDSNFQEMRNGIVHRLDKETSGVLLIAKTQDAFCELQRQFKDREVEKVYIGLVHGIVEPQAGVVDASIGRNPKNRMKFGVVESGREAVTEYKLVTCYMLPVTRETFSLVEFYPKTGRTHQIRVHAKHLGHPIVSDYQYAGRKTTRKDRKWCPRLFLHAAKLTFRHPKHGARDTIEAPLPQDLQQVLSLLQ